MTIFSRVKKLEKLSPRLRSLYVHRIIRAAGVGLVGIFGPIFFYVLSGENFRFVLVYYCLVSLLYFLFLPGWVKLLRRASMHIFMATASVFTIAYYITAYFLSQNQRIILSLIILLILFFALERFFYWVPYFVDLVRFMDKHHRGRQLSFLKIFLTLMTIGLPVFSAFVINRFGFSALFILVTVIIVISFIPLFFIPRTREVYSFNYWESYGKLFSKRHFKANLAYVADGFQTGVGLVIWPVFIFMLLKGNYLEVGIVSAAIILATCILQFSVGELTDRFDKKKLMRAGSMLYAAGWLFKAIVVSAWHIFLAGIFHDFTKVIMRTPLEVFTYEISADEGHYVDEFTVLKEMSLHFGRILMFVLAFIMIGFINITWIFVLAAFISLLVNLISKEELHILITGGRSRAT